MDEEIYKIDPLSQKEYAKSYLINIAKDVYGMFNKVIISLSFNFYIINLGTLHIDILKFLYHKEKQ